MSAAFAERTTIIRVEVGSGLHGIAVDGTDDRDEMGVCVEPPEYVVGLRHFEQYVYRTKPEGVRSGPGDLDLTIYSLRKYARLALNGNPSILALLFVPDDKCIVKTDLGAALQALAPAFAAKRAGKAFLGYMTQQRQRLLGERGQMNVKQPELEEAYGFDTKYAGHIIRLGFQGIEYLTTGRLTLPMPEAQRDHIIAVRTGKVAFNDVLTQAGEMERQMEDLLVSSPLSDEPDRAAVDSFLIDSYQRMWATAPFPSVSEAKDAEL